MTDEIRIFWSSIDQASLETSLYPDGMPLVPFPGVLDLREVIPRRMLVRPSSVGSLMTALWFVDALNERGMVTPELILPCVPGARQDRLNPEGDFLFTLKSVAREINLRRFPKVTVLDPHSDVAPALIERCEVITVANILRGSGHHLSAANLYPLSQYAAVVSPDAGAEKRAAKVAKLLYKPLLHAWKTRNVNTGDITGFGMVPRPGHWGATSVRRVLVVDDICDGGGTFVGLAPMLGLNGLVADLWTTHGYYTYGVERLREAGYRHLFTTDSVVHVGTVPGVDAIPVCETLLREGHL